MESVQRRVEGSEIIQNGSRKRLHSHFACPETCREQS